MRPVLAVRSYFHFVECHVVHVDECAGAAGDSDATGVGGVDIVDGDEDGAGLAVAVALALSDDAVLAEGGTVLGGEALADCEVVLVAVHAVHAVLVAVLDVVGVGVGDGGGDGVQLADE
jgi:hypothetical protein